MKIEQSAVAMHAGHHLSSEYVARLESFLARLLELISGKQDSLVTDLRAPFKAEMPEKSMAV